MSRLPIVISISALLVVAQGCENKSSRGGGSSPAEIDRMYNAQFDSEQERVEFEAWDSDRRELHRDAPTGQTRGGDPF